MSEPTRIYIEQWSAISQGDLGLKAGYQVAEGGEVAFREIGGWITISGRDPGLALARNLFVPVVVADNGYPTRADYLPGFLGTFGKDLSPAEALKKSEEWRTPQQEQIKPNVPGVGKA